MGRTKFHIRCVAWVGVVKVAIVILLAAALCQMTGLLVVKGVITPCTSSQAACLQNWPWVALCLSLAVVSFGATLEVLFPGRNYWWTIAWIGAGILTNSLLLAAASHTFASFMVAVTEMFMP